MDVELAPGVFAVGSAVFVEPLGMLVVADLQIGREEELRSHGHLVLDRELSSMKRRIAQALRQTGARRLLFNGDIKHEFARINRQEWTDILDLLDCFREKGIEIILVKGNHDNMLLPVARQRGYELLDHFAEREFLFLHGHEVPGRETLEGVETVIIGHEHPALRVNDGVRHETVKCFLVGPWKRRTLIVLPSFSEATTGTDVLESSTLSPFLKKKEKMAAFVLVEDSALRFGTLKDIKAALK